MRTPWLWIMPLMSFAFGCGGSDKSPCQQAANYIAQCTQQADASVDLTGCTNAGAKQVLSLDCKTVQASLSSGKSDFLSLLFSGAQLPPQQPECVPNQISCDGDDLVKCGSDGFYEPILDLCGFDQPRLTCVPGPPAHCACLDGESYCSPASALVTCQGGTWVSQNCSQGTTCTLVTEPQDGGTPDAGFNPPPHAACTP